MNKKNASSSKCADCGKITRKVADQEWVIDYRQNNPNWEPGDTIREYLCLNCGDRINQIRINEEKEKAKRHEEYTEANAKETANECFAELNKLNEEFDKKIDNEDLDVKDYKNFHSLKNKVNNLIKTKGVEKWDNYLTAEVDFNLLKESLKKLEEKVKENTSPQTIDKAKGLKERKVKCKYHEKGIEPCTDNPNFFCCSYCWDTESPEFLKKLRRQHTDNINKLLNEHGINVVKFRKNSNNYKKLTNDFSTQEELNSVYQATEQDLQIFLKKKGITITTARERERERERVQSQQQQLLTEITSLEQNSPSNQTELNSKKKQLQDLEKKEKELTKSLPLETQIKILEKEIKNLEQKTNKNQTEKALLNSKKQELERLLSEKQKNNTSENKKGDKTILYIGIGALVVAVLVSLVVMVIRAKNRK